MRHNVRQQPAREFNVSSRGKVTMDTSKKIKVSEEDRTCNATWAEVFFNGEKPDTLDVESVLWLMGFLFACLRLPLPALNPTSSIWKDGVAKNV